MSGKSGKRYISLLLAAVMVFSMAFGGMTLAAYASDEQTPETETVAAAVDVDADADEAETATVDADAAEAADTDVTADGVAAEADAEDADADGGVEAQSLTEETVTLTYVPDADDLPDNDELFEYYAWQTFYGGGGISTAADYGTTTLDGLDAKIYTALKAKIAAVAAGTATSTEFLLTWEELGISQTTWTDEELGVTIIEDGAITSDAVSAVTEKVGYVPSQMSTVVKCLLVDCPYELYWYDKTKGFSYPGGVAVTATSNGISSSISLDEDGLTFSFVVASAYAAEGESYVTDADTTGAAAAAVAAAKSVVEANMGKTDYEKLVAYKEWICSQVSYNSDAASDDYSDGYGDPWQLIYVFDGDSNTNVVCEGYSKAFQYLCDLSDFSSDVICYTVTGTMAGGTGAGAHMWNIVSIGDDNYLVDVTNSDDGTVGQNGGLFMVGNSSGSVADGYTFTINNQDITYTYDSSTTALYEDDILKLAEEDYKDCEHEWGDGLVTEEATCTEAGVMTYTCTKCGATKTAEITATGHTVVTNAAVAATCTETGLTEGSHCSVCKEVLVEQEVVPATGHSWDDGEVTTKATCTEAGEMTYTCTVCSETKTEEIKATGHSWETEYTVDKEASCTEEGSESIHCANCNETKDSQAIPATGHTWNEGEVTTAATCTVDGVMTYTCTVCKETETKVIAATGHSWDEGEITTAATCTDDGVMTYTCTVCKETETKVIAATGHSWNDGEVTTKATCTEAGEMTYACTKCDATKTEEIKATGHDWETEYTVDKKASCTEEGSKSIHCANCNETKDSQAIPATGHTWDEGEVTTAATCTEAGVMTYACTKCDATKTEEIEATGHSWDEGEITTAATCTDDGVMTYTCTVCKETETKVIAATGHSWNDGEVTTKATCTETGVKTYTCTVCKETKTEEIAATGHTVVTDEAVAATCTETGLTEGSHCSVCGAVLTAQEEIPALGHTEVKDEAVAATCTETGLTEGSHCSVCGAVLTAQEEIPALGHTEVKDEAVAATCTEMGLTEGSHCSVCGEVLTAQEEIPALGHTEVKDEAVAATCTETGLTEGNHCSVCGEVLTAQEVVAALGHVWDNGTVTTAATCTADGVMTYTCTVCSETKTEAISATGHTWDEGEVTREASAAEAGEMTYTCTVCGETKTEVFDVDTKVEVSETISITAELAAAGYDTEEAVSEELVKVVLEADDSYEEDNVAVYEVTLMVSFDNGETWEEATEENFPEEGITVTLPYPEGTNAGDYDFLVIHMFAAGENAGETETLTPEETENGLQVTVTSLSPMAIAWKEAEAASTPAPTATPVPTSGSKSDTPNTGDETAIALWAMLALGCAGGLAAVLTAGKKRREE